MEFLFFSWIFLSLVFSLAGKSRQIGFTRSLLFCLILSPIIGLIIILLSEKKSEALMKLKIAYDSNVISKQEYNRQVRKINPNKEDKQNMWIGFAIVAAIILIIYLITLIF